MSVYATPCQEFLAHLEQYFDSDNDRVAADGHLSECSSCRHEFEAMQERLRDLPCQEFVELVTGYLEGAVDDRTRGRVDQHLRLCEGCRRYLDQMRQTLDMVGRLSEMDDPPTELKATLRALFENWRRSN